MGFRPTSKLGNPVVEVLHSGLDLYTACAVERREIIARRTMTPHGYGVLDESLGGEYAGARRDARFNPDHGSAITWSDYLARLSGSSTWMGPRTKRRRGILLRPVSTLRWIGTGTRAQS